MISQQYHVERSCAAHCTYQGSNKDWVGILVHVISAEADPTATEAPDAMTWMFLSVYGKSGANLQGGGLAPLTTRQEAEKIFDAKVKEKLNKHHYVAVDIAPFLSAFRIPLVLPETDAAVASAKRATELQQEAEEASLRASGYESNKAEAVASWQAYTTESYGVTEKANGERCLVSYDGQHVMQGYNRTGTPTRTLPSSAVSLASLAVSFVLDGERLVGEQEGQYVVFDVLQWNGEDVRSWAYRERIALLQDAFTQAELTKHALATPTLDEALHNSLIFGLLLLTPVQGSEKSGHVVEVVRQHAGEGVILRRLAASYTSPNAVLKYKFTADIDVVVIGIKPGSAGGSLKIGLRRPSDNAMIACGHVRSGLTNQDITVLAEQLAQGIWPVIKVTYRLARTSGVVLVEASTSRAWIRSDKAPWSCTTDQLGEEKAALIEQAAPVPGIHIPER
jgi:hypothetical protein